MKIGLAQIKSTPGDIDKNIDRHLQVLEKTTLDNADLIMFPELSLSNYEPEMAKSVAIDPLDKRIAVFTPGERPASVLELTKKIGVAICHEINVDAHIVNASQQNMDMYLASAAKTEAGIIAARERLSVKAREYEVPILVTNSVGSCEGKKAGGGSAIICSDGKTIQTLSDTEEAILIYNMENGTAKKIIID